MANTKITSRVIADDAVTTAAIADDVALGGNPTTTTQSAGNSTTRIATTAFVTTAVSNLVDSAPGALDTLNELAAALGDDASFSTTVTNSIATKLPLAGGTMTGNIAHASDFTIDAGGDITLDADGGDIILKDGGTSFGQFSISSGDLYIQQPTADKDIVFRGLDDSTYVSALTLDMSEGGNAIFGKNVSINAAGASSPAPLQAFQVILHSGGGRRGTIYYNSNSRIAFAALNASNTWESMEIEGADIKFRTGGSSQATAMFIDDGGKLGIQTTTEADGTAMTFPLTISGANDGGNILEAHRTANSKFQLYMSDAGSAYIDVGGTTPKLKIRTSGTDRVNIHESNGYVGLIGSSDVRLTLSSEGTEGDNSANWVRGNSAGLSFNAKTSGKHMWEINGDEKMRIHSGGQLTTEYQPSFSARLANTSSVNATTSTIKLQYGGHSVPHNVGSHYSTSNYEFTAPVAGSYFFSANLRIDGFAGSYSYLTLKHEATNGTVTDRARDLTSLQATYKNHCISAVVYMAVNEKVYVTLNEVGDGDVNLDADSWFNGYLLG